MAVLNATDITILLPGTIGKAWNRIAHTTSAEVELSGEEKLTTNFDTSGWDTSVITKRRWSMRGTALMVFESYSFEHLFDLWIAGANLLVRWATESGQGYQGYAKITSLGGGGGTEQNVAISFSLSGQGAFGKISDAPTTTAATTTL